VPDPNYYSSEDELPPALGRPWGRRYVRYDD